MSYILEALKKSQQEKELGEIPTLETKPNRLSTPLQPNALSAWNLSALLLGLTALLIAAYGTFGDRWFETSAERERQQTESSPAQLNRDAAPDQVGETRLGSPPTAAADTFKAPHTPAAPPVTKEKPAARPTSPQPPIAAKAEKPLYPTQEPNPTSPAATNLTTETTTEQTGPARSESASTQQQRTAAAVPATRRERLFKEAEKLKQRLLKLQAEESAASINASLAPLKRPVDKAPAKKQAQENSRPAPSGQSHQPATPSRRSLPTDRELPTEVYESLPERRVIVHVFTEAPEGRFIILNSTKLRQGEETPDGLRLEEILPDGMIFRYKGKRFRQLK